MPEDAAEAQPESPPEDVRGPEIEQVLKIPVQVKVTLAAKKMDLDEILELSAGTVLQFNKAHDAHLDLYVGEQQIGRGEAVTIRDKFGLRVREICTVQERIEKLGEL